MFIFIISCGNTNIDSQAVDQSTQTQNNTHTQDTQNENQLEEEQEKEIIDEKTDDSDEISENDVNKEVQEESKTEESNNENTQNTNENHQEEIIQETDEEQENNSEIDQNEENFSQEQTQNEDFDILEEISEDYLQNSDFEVSQEGYMKKNVYTIWKYKFPEDEYTHKIKKSLCVADMCFYVWTPVNIKNNWIVFTPTYDYDAIWYDPVSWDYYKTSQSDWPDVTIVNRHLTFENTLVDSTISSSCWGTNYKQTANGKLSKLPEVISYGNVDFYLQDLNFTGKYYMMNNDGIWRLGYTQDLVSQDKNSNTVNVENVEEKLAEQVELKNKLQTTYYVNLLEYPGVTIPYKTDKQLAFWVYQSDENLENGNVKNIEIAKKIYEKMASYYVLSHEVNGTIPDPSDEILTQIFRIQKVKDNHYLVYINEKFSLQSMAEMCKPLIYIYGKDSQNMSVNLQTIENSQFTKLIPDFQETNTWNFSTKNDKVYFWNTSYDYLYYAIKVPNYSHNKNGWIIQWSQAEKFFHEKLDYIGFNKQEKEDFIEYWKPKYEENKYYFVSFKFNQQLDTFVKLNFSETPDSIFRVLLDSYQIENKLSIPSQFWYENATSEFDNKILEIYTRTWKYDVFEWGGVLQTFDKKYIK